MSDGGWSAGTTGAGGGQQLVEGAWLHRGVPGGAGLARWACELLGAEVVRATVVRPGGDLRPASGTGRIGWHTDLPELAPRWLVLRCAVPDATGGGANLVCAGAEVAQLLGDEALGMLALDWPVLLVAGTPRRGHRSKVALRSAGGVWRCGPARVRAALAAGAAVPAGGDAAVLDELEAAAERCGTEVLLGAGEVLVVDNHAVLHDRTPIMDPGRVMDQLWLGPVLGQDPSVAGDATG